jgi:hypothetical protein
VDLRTKQCRVEIHHDEEHRTLEDACGDGFVFGQANPRTMNYVPGDEIPIPGEGDVMFAVDVYEHGRVLYSLSGGGPQCQFDTAKGGAFILLLDEAGWNMENAESIARGIAENITAWANGDIYGYTVDDMTGEEIDSCWGFLDTGTYFIDEVRAAIGDLIVVETNDLAESMGIQKVAA